MSTPAPAAPPRPRKRWVIEPERPEQAALLSRELKVSPLLAQMLINRGMDEVDTATNFLKPDLKKGMHPPKQLAGMDVAAKRICAAIEAKQRVTIYSDYDVDGVTSAAVLFHFFELVGLPISTFVPERKKDGYGLNTRALDEIAEAGCDLLITVDCGIRGIEPVAHANALGMDVIVTDHHTPGEVLPDALAVINPKLAGSEYPFDGLCGAGVAFKLAWATAVELSGEGDGVTPELRAFLKQALGLAAIGTIADIVPLKDENRVIAWWGLRCLPTAPWAGLRGLIAASDLAGKPVLAEHVAFRIGPRLNAAGRMGSAQRALDLLTTKDQEHGVELAEELAVDNRKRQQVERDIAAQATQQVIDGDMTQEKVLVLAGQGWHAGVVGIVASRMVERFARPTVMIALDGETGRGSVRSVPGFPILDALLSCESHLIRVGGHAMAAGLEIRADQVDAFREALQAICRETLDDDLLVPTQRIDTLARFVDIDGRLIDELSWLEPTGAGNRPAILGTREVEITTMPRQFGKDGAHLAFYGRADGRGFRVVAWRAGARALEFRPGDRVDIAYKPVVSTFQGVTSVELHLLDLQPSASG